MGVAKRYTLLHEGYSVEEEQSTGYVHMVSL